MGLLDVLNRKNIVEPKQDTKSKETPKEDLSIEEKMRNFRMKSTYPAHDEETMLQDQELMDIYEDRGANVVILAPKNADYCETISREIKSRKIVIIKLGKVSETDSLKIVHFIYGMCSAMEIEPKLVDDTIYLVDATTAEIYKKAGE